MRRLLQSGIHQQTEKVEQYFSIGDGCLCGVANEIMVEFALRVSELLHDNFFYFGGYTNGCRAIFQIFHITKQAASGLSVFS